MAGLLYGWNLVTWQRALKWAGADDLNLGMILQPRAQKRFLEIQRKWLEAGGPMAGPRSDLIL
jgi:hypothetical protein